MNKPHNGGIRVLTNRGPGDGARVLVCRVQARLCALPLEAVEETLRPLPLRPLTAPVVQVLGLARIRGDWLPVLDLAAVLGLPSGAVDRFVIIRTGPRRVALAVSQVIGLQSLEAEALSALPPLLRDGDHAAVTALAQRDDELMAVLDEARLMPDGLADALADQLPDAPADEPSNRPTAAAAEAPPLAEDSP